jgi:hypothetical protein
MDWQTILMIVIAALLLFVWLPILVISVRRTLRKSRQAPHPEHTPCHSERSEESQPTKNE